MRTEFPGVALAVLLLSGCGNSVAPPATNTTGNGGGPDDNQTVSVPVPSAPALSDAISEQELTAVGLDYFEAYWRTAQPADTTICLFPPQGAGRCERQETGQTYHLARITGLAPGTAYRYWLISDGARARTVNDTPAAALPALNAQVLPDAAANPGQFTTLTPPPGKRVGTVALMSDLHVGEGCSGQAFGFAGQSVPPCTVVPGYTDGSDGHGQRMLAGAVAQIAALKPDAVLVLGDLTSAAAYTDMTLAKSLLDRLPMPYYVLRGNHDRPAQGGSGETEFCGTTQDCYSTVFRPLSTQRIQPIAVDVHGVRFLMLDANDTSGRGDLTDTAQQTWVAQQLAAHPKARTFILSHEPASVYSNATTYVPGFGVIPTQGGSWLHDVIKANPQVSATFAGHTHRNLLGYDADTGRLPWVEIGANKEYAAGFTLLHLYEGGFVREYHRVDCVSDSNFCREWTSLSRGQNFGLQFTYMLGELKARAFTYVDDCSHNTPRLPSLPYQVGGDTGQDVADCRGNLTYPLP